MSARPMCSVDGCESPSASRGWCSHHYQRWRRSGDPGGLESRRREVLACPTGDACQRLDFDEWCAAFRAHMLVWLCDNASVVDPPEDPLARSCPGPCWVGLGTRSKGYANISIGNRPRRIHRVAMATRCTSIGWATVDHLCRRPDCFSPWHLEPVTNRENVLRGRGVTSVNALKTHCIHGHEFTPENTQLQPKTGYRYCRECRRRRSRSRPSRARR